MTAVDEELLKHYKRILPEIKERYENLGKSIANIENDIKELEDKKVAK